MSPGDAVSNILEQLDRGRPSAVAPLGGGCIADAAVATFDDGTRVFVKQASGAPGMFESEAEGLRALAAAGALRVPGVIAVSADALVLEYIEQGDRAGDFHADFGRRFALLHQQRAGICGFAHDGFIGSTPQPNAPVHRAWDPAAEGDGGDWPEFFLERRLRFQVELAEQKGHGDELAGLLDRSEATIADLLGADIEQPSLLHGDLWGGNYLVDDDGRACLIDPAAYYGHREADLAMTRLFGGFDPEFYAAYDEAWPLVHGWQDRLPLYQLYHLLNHLNLFGSGYYGRCQSILERLARK